MLDAADLDRRGSHQRRHTFASLLLQDGIPTTYVSRQLEHKDPSIALRCTRTGCLTNLSAKLVDALDYAPPRVTQASPTTPDDEVQRAVSRFAISGERPFVGRTASRRPALHAAWRHESDRFPKSVNLSDPFSDTIPTGSHLVHQPSAWQAR